MRIEKMIIHEGCRTRAHHVPFKTSHITEEEEDEEEEEEPLLIYTAQGSPFRCKKLSVIRWEP